MNAKDFNNIWHKIAEKELLPAGFIRSGNSYLAMNGTTVFQFYKNTHKTKFTGFLYGYTHSFLETWTNEYPTKWPLLLEQLIFVFSGELLQECELKGLEKGAILALDYSQGKRDLHKDFTELNIDNWNEKEAEDYVLKSISIAKIEGRKILQKLDVLKCIELLEGKVTDSFMPEKWLLNLKATVHNKNYI